MEPPPGSPFGRRSSKRESTRLNAGDIAVIVIAGIVVGSIALFMLVSCRHRVYEKMKKFRKISLWKKGKQKKLEVERICQRDLKRERLVAEVQQVALRERDTKSESTVWVSRLVYDGWPRQLALVTAGAKYDLCKISDDKEGRYTYKMTQPWSIDLEEFDAFNPQS
jgi:hypothetical protein